VARSGLIGPWLEWIRLQPGLAAAVLVFCLVAIVGLVLTLPRGALVPIRMRRSTGGASVSEPSMPESREPAARPEPTARGPGVPGSESPPPAPEAGPWVQESPSAPSARGLALAYRYRVLPPGGDSRYEWIVQVRGAASVLEDVEVVTWRMEPAAKNGAEFTSRDRAADGFPLFGSGPGGWFGVSAAVRYKDGGDETLARRIEFPD
jgi:hypothetical protein